MSKRVPRDVRDRSRARGLEQRAAHKQSHADRGVREVEERRRARVGEAAPRHLQEVIRREERGGSDAGEAGAQIEPATSFHAARIEADDSAAMEIEGGAARTDGNRRRLNAQEVAAQAANARPVRSQETAAQGGGGCRSEAEALCAGAEEEEAAGEVHERRGARVHQGGAGERVQEGAAAHGEAAVDGVEQRGGQGEGASLKPGQRLCADEAALEADEWARG